MRVSSVVRDGCSLYSHSKDPRIFTIYDPKCPGRLVGLSPRMIDDIITVGVFACIDGSSLDPG